MYDFKCFVFTDLWISGVADFMTLGDSLKQIWLKLLLLQWLTFYQSVGMAPVFGRSPCCLHRHTQSSMARSALRILLVLIVVLPLPGHADTVVLGATGSSSCPAGSSEIETSQECQDACSNGG